MRFERTVDVAAHPDEAFAAYVDVTTWPEGTESVTSVERLDAGHLVVGAHTRVEAGR